MRRHNKVCSMKQLDYIMSQNLMNHNELCSYYMNSVLLFSEKGMLKHNTKHTSGIIRSYS